MIVLKGLLGLMVVGFIYLTFKYHFKKRQTLINAFKTLLDKECHKNQWGGSKSKTAICEGYYQNQQLALFYGKTGIHIGVFVERSSLEKFIKGDWLLQEVKIMDLTHHSLVRNMKAALKMLMNKLEAN
jgi:hypothetical protein